MSPITRLRRLEPIERTFLKLGAFCATLLVVVLALVIALIALSSADDANTGLHGGCGFLRGVATAPVTNSTSPLGLAIVQQARFWYQAADCAGALPPPDPRIGG